MVDDKRLYPCHFGARLCLLVLCVISLVTPGASACNNNGVLDNGETGIDCGGVDCPACTGSTCNNNGVLDNGETGIDCGGGDCPACTGSSTTCNNCDGAGGCPFCICNYNNITDNGETGVDCGGGGCPNCATCKCGGVCPKCSSCNYNGQMDGSEAGIDCGGNCPACLCNYNGKHDNGEDGIDCGGADCPPCSCRNGIQDSGEESVDCGGANCPACPPVYDDGSSTGCNNNGVKDGGEEGVDCGSAPLCSPCPVLARCNNNGVQDNGELGVDCRGENNVIDDCVPCPDYGGVDSNQNDRQDIMPIPIKYSGKCLEGEIFRYMIDYCAKELESNDPNPAAPTGPSACDNPDFHDEKQKLVGKKCNRITSVEKCTVAGASFGYRFVNNTGKSSCATGVHQCALVSVIKSERRRLLPERTLKYPPQRRRLPENEDVVSLRCLVDTGGSGGGSCNVDAAQDGEEEGIDCGGPNCPACGCNHNGIQDNGEEGVDCGGAYCPPCGCNNNGVQDGDEMGIDCGGGSCTQSCGTPDPAAEPLLPCCEADPGAADAGAADPGASDPGASGAKAVMCDGACFPCPINSYEKNNNCVPCPKDKPTTRGKEGQTQCFACNEGGGFFAEAIPENSRCKPCPSTFYGKNNSCIPCPKDKPTTRGNEGQTQCFACEAGNEFFHKGLCRCPFSFVQNEMRTQCIMSAGLITLINLFVVGIIVGVSIKLCCKKKLSNSYKKNFDKVDGKYYLTIPLLIALIGSYDVFGDIFFLWPQTIWSPYPQILLISIFTKESLKMLALISTLFVSTFRKPDVSFYFSF